MNKFSHHLKCNMGTVQVHVGPPPITPIKVITMTNWINILLRLNCVGIRRQKNRTFMNSKWPCLITAIRRIFVLRL